MCNNLTVTVTASAIDSSIISSLLKQFKQAKLFVIESRLSEADLQAKIEWTMEATMWHTIYEKNPKDISWELIIQNVNVEAIGCSRSRQPGQGFLLLFLLAL